MKTKLININFFKLTAKSLQLKANKGFTLVELLVTISIFVIITAVVLVNSNSFDNSVLLHNFAYDVALTVKQAQSYGVNVKENISGSFNSSYGVYFDVSADGSNKNFVLFNDFDNSSTTDSVIFCDITSECLQKYSMTRGTFIKSICAGTDENDCDSNPADQLSILFRRPNLGAMIYKNKETDPNYKSYAKIVLSAANGATSNVVVTSVGQIYVKR